MIESGERSVIVTTSTHTSVWYSTGSESRQGKPGGSCKRDFVSCSWRGIAARTDSR